MVNKQAFTDTFQYFDKEVIIEIIDIFIDESPERLKVLEQNINEGNFEKLRFNVHSLKGVVANFAAPMAVEKIKIFERTAAELAETGGGEFNKEEMLLNLATIKEMVNEMIEDLKVIKAES